MNNTLTTNLTAIEQIQLAEGYCPYLPFVFAYVVLIFQATVLWLTIFFVVSLCIISVLVKHKLATAPAVFKRWAKKIPLFGDKIVQRWETAEEQ